MVDVLKGPIDHQSGWDFCVGSNKILLQSLGKGLSCPNSFWIVEKQDSHIQGIHIAKICSLGIDIPHCIQNLLIAFF